MSVLAVLTAIWILWATAVLTATAQPTQADAAGRADIDNLTPSSTPALTPAPMPAPTPAPTPASGHAGGHGGGHGSLRGASTMRNDDVSPQPTTPSTSTSFGPFEKLLGTWRGTRGVNVVSLPQYTESSGVSADFVVLGHEFNETLTFTPILGKVRNRGYSHANQMTPTAQLDQVLMGVTYHLSIVDSFTGELLHVENGQWLWNQAPGIDTQWSVSRASIIPHGVALVALGKDSTMTGTDVEAELQAMKGSEDWLAEPQNLGSAAFFGYFEGKAAAGCTGKNGSASKADCMSPISRLIEDIGPVQNMTATRLQVSTLQDGASLTMLPNVKAQAETKAFNATFWVERITDDEGHIYDQLQYAQNVFLAFETNFDCRQYPMTSSCSFNNKLILWPHIQVNTLRKIAQDPVLTSFHDLPHIR